MDHRPDLAEEGCDQGMIEIHKNINAVAGFAGIFHRVII
jgi:hypothetical protein